MKIALFHLSFLYSGGGEKLVLKEIELLTQAGHTVDCYAPLIDPEECFPEIIKKYNIKEIIKGTTKIFLGKPELGVAFTCLLFPFIAFKFRKYDTIIGANQPGPLFGWILKILLRKPYIAYIAQPTRLIYPRPIDREVGLRFKSKMNFFPHVANILRPFIYWLDLKSITSAHTLFTNGEYMKEIIEQIYGKTATICHPGAKWDYKMSFLKQNKQNSITINNNTYPTPYICLTNRHFPQKKFEYAIEAIRHLDHKIPVLIAGKETYYTQSLKKLVQSYHLEDRIHFLGYVSETDIEILYKNSSLYLYTAIEEDFGMGIVEAMGYGIPVIAINRAGPSKIITHNHNGFLVEPDDHKAMASTIKKCLNNRELVLKIGKNAVHTIRKNYSWGNHANILGNTLKSIANTNHKTDSKTSLYRAVINSRLTFEGKTIS